MYSLGNWKGRFAIESYADTSGRWTFSLNNDQMALQIQCQQSNCWRDRNQSDRVDPPTCVEIAAGFDVHFPLHVKDYFPALQFRGRESLADKTVVVLEGSSPQLKPVKLVFDAQSGLLVQLGSTEFQDYRECDGVRRPFVSVSPMDGKATYREIQHNRGIPSEVFKGSSHAAAQTDSK